MKTKKHSFVYTEGCNGKNMTITKLINTKEVETLTLNLSEMNLSISDCAFLISVFSRAIELLAHQIKILKK
jgi:hypothetical protein